jgi:hypothetical protein
MKRIPTSVAAALVVVFSAFNIGMPMVIHLCPMMQGSMMQESAVCCPVSRAPIGTTQLSNQVGDCCDSYIVAERNTVPFLKVLRIDATSIDTHVATPCIDPQSSDAPRLRTFANISSVFHTHAPPLFLLHSSLLI